jgi:hypothetical protein
VEWLKHRDEAVVLGVLVDSLTGKHEYSVKLLNGGHQDWVERDCLRVYDPAVPSPPKMPRIMRTPPPAQRVEQEQATNVPRWRRLLARVLALLQSKDKN